MVCGNQYNQKFKSETEACPLTGRQKSYILYSLPSRGPDAQQLFRCDECYVSS